MGSQYNRVNLYGLYGIAGWGTIMNDSYTNRYLRHFGFSYPNTFMPIKYIHKNENKNENKNINNCSSQKNKIECKYVNTQPDYSYTRSINTQCIVDGFELITIKDVEHK